MASFSNDVRGEICCTVTDKDKKYACLYGIILFCRHISEKSVTINTESEKFFKLSCELIKSVFNRNIIFETEIIQKKKPKAKLLMTDFLLPSKMTTGELWSNSVVALVIAMLKALIT